MNPAVWNGPTLIRPRHTKPSALAATATLALLLAAGNASLAHGQTTPAPAVPSGQIDPKGSTQNSQPGTVSGAIGGKSSPTGQAAGQDDKSASKPASAGEEAASTTKLKLGPARSFRRSDRYP